MSIDTWTSEQLDELYELARRASEGEWKWMITPTKTVNAAVRWVAKTIRKSDNAGIWGVLIGSLDDPQVVAYTGNGSTSEANSAYLVAVQPRNVRSLIDDLLYARSQLQERTIERDYARQQRDDARAELVRLRSVRVQPVSPRPCDSCGEPLDNLLGQYVMSGHGRTREVCHKCKPVLEADGYVVMVYVKGM